ILPYPVPFPSQTRAGSVSVSALVFARSHAEPRKPGRRLHGTVRAHDEGGGRHYGRGGTRAGAKSCHRVPGAFTMMAAPATMAAAPATMAAAPVTMAAAPVTMTAAPVTMAAAPVTVAAAPVTMTAAPVTMTAAPSR